MSINYRDVSNLVQMVRPRLHGLQNSGNASTIHDVNNHLLRIDSAEENYKYWIRTGKQDKAEGQLLALYKYTLDAEQWMVELARAVTNKE